MNKTRPKNKRTNQFSKPSNSTGFNSRRNSTPKKKAVSTLDPNKLINKSITVEEAKYVPARSFAEMPLHASLKANILKKGFENPTKIQDKTLEFLIEGRDMVGIANTGTGKTGAFLIPIIEQLLSNNRFFQTLVIVPTRELAQQVEEEFKGLSRGLGLNSACFIGGTKVERDLDQLRKRNHIIIGTPGRLMDLAGRGALNIRQISTLVLDEFDRMLDMGFVNDIKRILTLMINRKQTMLFSATIDKSQKTMVDDMLNDPIEIKVSQGYSANNQIDQDIIKVPQGADKFDLLVKLIRTEECEKVLVFSETKRMADKIAKKLNQSSLTADTIHGNKSQNYRVNALNRFKRGDVTVLVATDVAARGIDVSDVSHVINYQLPMTFDAYVHRIGRTGRAGKGGKAFTFID